MINKYTVLGEIMSLMFFLAGTQSAYATDERVVPILEQPIEKKIIEEEVYTFIEQTYDPPYEIDLTNNMDKVTNASPEGAVALQYSVLLQGDYNRRLDGLTENDVKIIKKQTLEEQLSDAESLKKQANYFLKGNKSVLHKKLSIGNSLVIIDQSVYKMQDGSLIIDLPIALELENDKWKGCIDCGGNENHKLYPFLINVNYRFPEKEKIITINKTFTPKPSSFLWKEKKTEVK